MAQCLSHAAAEPTLQPAVLLLMPGLPLPVLGLRPEQIASYP